MYPRRRGGSAEVWEGVNGEEGGGVATCFSSGSTFPPCALKLKGPKRGVELKGGSLHGGCSCVDSLGGSGDPLACLACPTNNE